MLGISRLYNVKIFVTLIFRGEPVKIQLEGRKTGSAYEKVNFWLGHKKHSQTKTYIDFAQIFNDDNGSWLSHALKQCSIGGLHVSPETQQTPKNDFTVFDFSDKLERVCWDSNPGQRLRKPL